MPSFQDSAVLVILALLLFGPKKLPVLARQLGKLMADFRRASNEFRTQMEEELRISEQAERQKQVAAIEAAAPATIIPEPEHPHLPPPAPSFVASSESESGSESESTAGYESASESETRPLIDSPSEPLPAAAYPPGEAPSQAPAAAVVPIATSGELSILPPSTGLPLFHLEPANSAPAASPEPAAPAHDAELQTETLHG
jgi:sec-independent protein translocase protein TatB